MKTKNMNKKTAKQYWRQNIKYLVILLTIWFTVSFGFGILLIDELNQFKIGGFKLGFWFAQQGSIYVFVILILTYIILMNKLDKKYNIK
jgi:putative solute:sodium symporter small subunit